MSRERICGKLLRSLRTAVSISVDKRTDVWSRDFIIWNINSGLDCEIKESGPIMSKVFFSLFQGQKKNFWPWKSEKNRPQKLLIIGPDPFISQSSPELMFHIMKSRDQTSVLLSVKQICLFLFLIWTIYPINGLCFKNFMNTPYPITWWVAMIATHTAT